MVLVDTSVWINHFRDDDQHMQELLLEGVVLCHPHIIGELACGNLKNRREILSLLQELPKAPTVELPEFLFFIDQHHLNGRGIGFVDIHILASARLDQVPLWTKDKRLNSAAEHLGLRYSRA